MARYNKTKTAKADNLEEFAKVLRSFADEYEQLAAKLRQTDFRGLKYWKAKV